MPDASLSHPADEPTPTDAGPVNSPAGERRDLPRVSHLAHPTTAPRTRLPATTEDILVSVRAAICLTQPKLMRRIRSYERLRSHSTMIPLSLGTGVARAPTDQPSDVAVPRHGATPSHGDAPGASILGKPDDIEARRSARFFRAFQDGPHGMSPVMPPPTCARLERAHTSEGPPSGVTRSCPCRVVMEVGTGRHQGGASRCRHGGRLRRSRVRSSRRADRRPRRPAPQRARRWSTGGDRTGRAR